MKWNAWPGGTPSLKPSPVGPWDGMGEILMIGILDLPSLMVLTIFGRSCATGVIPAGGNGDGDGIPDVFRGRRALLR